MRRRSPSSWEPKLARAVGGGTINGQAESGDDPESSRDHQDPGRDTSVTGAYTNKAAAQIERTRLEAVAASDADDEKYELHEVELNEPTGRSTR
jgi:hypothetical protein